jgi:hypothetical protein
VASSLDTSKLQNWSAVCLALVMQADNLRSCYLSEIETIKSSSSRFSYFFALKSHFCLIETVCHFFDQLTTMFVCFKMCACAWRKNVGVKLSTTSREIKSLPISNIGQNR